MNYMKSTYWCSVVVATLLLPGCVDLDDTTSASLENQTLSVALPIINTEATIVEVAEESATTTSVTVDSEGKLTLYYFGEVVRNNATAIFPPVPGLLPFPIEDTVARVGLPFEGEYVISKAIFRETTLFFTFSSEQEEDVDIVLTMPGVTRNGETFQQRFKLIYDGTTPTTLEAQAFNVDGWQVILNNNEVEFEYTAILASGERIVLDEAFMRFDVLKFAYVEGYFGNKVFDIEGDIIDIGVFTNWKSGGLSFEDPKVTLQTDNSFGFPVRSRVNKLELETVSGDILQVESEFVDIGIDFDYPQVDEIGQVKTKYFAFTKDNSNIKDVFNERAKRVSYDFDAVANPDNDTTKVNFVDESSFFNVNVAVELPLELKANDLVLVDTVDLDLNTYEEVTDARFKIKSRNDFPVDVTVQANFLNENNQIIDQMFEGDGLKLSAAILGPDGIALPPQEFETFLDFDVSRFDNIRTTKKVEITYRLSSENVTSDPVWIYDDYAIGFRVGAIFNIEN